MCEERDGSGYKALGGIVEAEGERFSFLSDDVIHELERRPPSGTEERNDILEARTRHDLLYNGTIGARRLDRVTGEHLLRWHREFAKPSKVGGTPRIRFAHALMTQLRIVLMFGRVLNIADAKELRSVMEDMEFATAPQRDAFILPEQVEAVRKAAHARGLPSVALATAIMFEAVLRQKDVIGE